jgi:hypothetical protein
MPVTRRLRGVLRNPATSERASSARHKRVLRAETAPVKQHPRAPTRPQQSKISIFPVSKSPSTTRHADHQPSLSQAIHDM